MEFRIFVITMVKVETFALILNYLILNIIYRSDSLHMLEHVKSKILVNKKC